MAEQFGEIQGWEIFEAGRHKGENWPETALDTIAINFERHPELKPPVYLGHDEDQKLAKASGFPAVGWVKRVWRSGKKLLADVADVPKVVVDLIQKRAYQRCSPTIYYDWEHHGPALRDVGLFGRDIPAVKTLQDVQALYGEDDPRCITLDSRPDPAYVSLAELADELAAVDAAERPRRILDTFNRLVWSTLDNPALTDRQTRILELVDELKSLLEREQFSEGAGTREEETSMTDEERKQFEATVAELAALKAQIAQFAEALRTKDGEIAELRKADGHRATVAKVDKVKAAIARFTEQGRYKPAWTSAGLVGVLLTLPDDEASVARFAEGEKAAEETPLDAGLRILSTFDKVVQFGETARQGGAVGAPEPGFMDVARKLAADEKLTITDAMARVMREQPALYAAFREESGQRTVTIAR